MIKLPAAFKFVVVAALSPLTLVAQPPQQFAELGKFRLQSGQAIANCKIGYRTFGSLDQERGNAVLFPTWFSGRSQDLAGLIGPGGLVDDSRFFVIAVDALGNGVSSSPSNSLTQPGESFPQFTVADMVESQAQLLSKVLKIPRLHAVIGISMGGMQAFQWAVTHPDLMKRVVPIVGSPQLTSYDLLLWEAELRAIQASRACGCPELARSSVAAIHNLALQTPEYRVEETDATAFPQLLKGIDDAFGNRFQPDDWASQLRAMMAHDVARESGGSLQQAARAVNSDLLVVVARQDHMVNPVPAIRFAHLLGARLITLDSNCGHLAAGCESGRVNARVRQFLESPEE